MLLPDLFGLPYSVRYFMAFISTQRTIQHHYLCLGLWKVGLLAADSKTGSLDASGYWVAVSGASFVASEWFSVHPPVAIVGGAIAGVIYGAVKGAPVAPVV